MPQNVPIEMSFNLGTANVRAMLTILENSINIIIEDPKNEFFGKMFDASIEEGKLEVSLEDIKLDLSPLSNPAGSF